ncbi:MAG: cellobiose phosphorylase, partial [Thermoleophilaceae bacterium]|nr:cellobiose phosphorylase [Thermoleophilaceae bacterium]
APQAKQPEIAGRTDAWHQVGNDHVIADAFNHGYTQLWSQDRRWEWTNFYQASGKHFAGGYGYLRVDGKTVSTLYDDRPSGAPTEREFGTGYYRKRVQAHGVDVQDFVYAPFGDDPLLLHDVTLRNTTASAKQVSWFEYWDVNPYQQSIKTNLGLGLPSYDASARTLSVAQLPDSEDHDPLSIFAAALQGPVGGFDTSTQTFFGAGGRAAPAAVAADHLAGTIAPPNPEGNSGQTMFAFRAPLTLAPGQSVTLRYAYGAAHANRIAGLVSRYRQASDPLATSERAWADWVPQASLGPNSAWLSRELQWDAYMLRSGASYEDCQGRHIISQGGYYQYDTAFQGAFRDPLQHMLPIVYSDPALARDVLIYSAQEQPPGAGAIPYAMVENCKRLDLGTSDDLDLWLLYAASEYGLASRDFAFFDQQVGYQGAGSGSFWDHLKLAYQHQEAQLGPHGDYITGATGDWSDFSTEFLQMTESNLVTAQLAYVYPRLAQLADARGDHAFAAQLRSSAARDLATTRREWTGRGWYSRGYSGNTQLGQGAIFGEPQPWAMLAGAPSASQAGTLVANIRRFLTGVGAPPQLHGPARTGSSQSPSANDPLVTEHSQPPVGDAVGTHNAVWVGGTWYAINGALAWGLGTLEGVVPHAVDYAFDEFKRNTLAAHADTYPGHWDGVISVDDVCRSFYSDAPSTCGTGLSSAYEGQIMHQPAWSLFDAVKLAGIEPTAAGYAIAPHLPFEHFSLRFPNVGVAYETGRARGYVTPQRDGSMQLDVRLAPDADPATVLAWANGRRVPSSLSGGSVRFRLEGKAGQPADWALTWGTNALGLPSRCVDRRRFSFKLHHARHARVVRVDLFVNGKRKLHRRGHDIRRIAIARLPQKRFTIRIVATQSSGSQLISTRRYNGCRKSRPHTRAHHHRRG